MARLVTKLIQIGINYSTFQFLKKLPHFGEYRRQREEILSNMHKEGSYQEKLVMHHGDPNKDVIIFKSTQEVNGYKTPLKIEDVMGRALSKIGTYGQLDNTKQVVALIDDVSYNQNFFPSIIS